MDAVPAAAAQRWPGRITERSLADGRPILYFDDQDTPGPVH